MNEQQQWNHEHEPEINYWGSTPEKEYYKIKGIKGSKSFYKSPRGLTLFTRSWLPISNPPPPSPSTSPSLSPSPSPSPSPRGVICMVHGYGNNISWTFQSTAIFLAQMGFACFALDIEGHGGSQGLKGYVPNVDLVVEDCVSFFNTVKQDLKGLPCFLYGESMGGAICLLIHFADPKGFDGAVLAAPMCKISDEVKPRWPIPQVLTFVAKFLPTWDIVPTEDLLYKSIKVEEKKPIAESNPDRYRGKPRLGTVTELLRITEKLEKRLGDVSIPFLVLHGSGDVVTDPNVSKALYEEAKSDDKSIRIYEGMMHSLLFGEPDENIEMVRDDIVNWLNQRCK